ncbi:deoxyribose-phosphate aldolase [Wenzhouxiangella limi]|uniref:Deoxyribose-phosphate aldolase n=1 Tax=Wenzhouxiangella limi TaxID=2707351 RepID=A0A845V2W5_9GAMM|nr:deoxyribose-phosphate aldolase [Wenzhouxiangella limi]NDY96610.1 deoxyribose-phosphate aldolase [Wenzhouxiangella limi]
MQDTARLVLSLLDLTSLDDTDTDEDIQRLCRRANTKGGHPAAVCVLTHLVAQARTALANLDLQDTVRVATVVNFPEGDQSADEVVDQIRAALTSGADEIDLVFPYRALMSGDERLGYHLVSRCRQASSGHVLKVILETGELKSSELIRTAAEIALAAGADFLKTSTGKVAVNATPEAAAVMMETIRDSGRPVGFKAAGGIRTTEQAAVYLDLGREILGEQWLRPERFRFGASGLLDDLLQRLGSGVRPVDLRSRY